MKTLILLLLLGSGNAFAQAPVNENEITTQESELNIDVDLQIIKDIAQSIADVHDLAQIDIQYVNRDNKNYLEAGINGSFLSLGVSNDYHETPHKITERIKKSNLKCHLPTRLSILIDKIQDPKNRVTVLDEYLSSHVHGFLQLCKHSNTDYRDMVVLEDLFGHDLHDILELAKTRPAIQRELDSLRSMLAIRNTLAESMRKSFTQSLEYKDLFTYIEKITNFRNEKHKLYSQNYRNNYLDNNQLRGILEGLPAEKIKLDLFESGLILRLKKLLPLEKNLLEIFQSDVALDHIEENVAFKVLGIRNFYASEMTECKSQSDGKTCWFNYDVAFRFSDKLDESELAKLRIGLAKLYLPAGFTLDFVSFEHLKDRGAYGLEANVIDLAGVTQKTSLNFGRVGLLLRVSGTVNAGAINYSQGLNSSERDLASMSIGAGIGAVRFGAKGAASVGLSIRLFEKYLTKAVIEGTLSGRTFMNGNNQSEHRDYFNDQTRGVGANIFITPTISLRGAYQETTQTVSLRPDESLSLSDQDFKSSFKQGTVGLEFRF